MGIEKIVTCVPNFSEGRDKAIVNQIAEAITGVKGITLLNVDSGRSTNRTVMTFIGTPENAVEAAFRAVKRASLLIDMSKHFGSHSRMGATDVFPFIPVTGITFEECIDLAKRLGERIGRELEIPVYLYGKAATVSDRIRLADIRSGEYEALPKKLKNSAFKPDYGPAKFNRRSGAIAVGVRDVMLAYNINLNTRDLKFAKTIAMNVRESGRAKRDEEGQLIRDPEGEIVQITGKLPFCQALGWYIEEYDCAQVTMNLINYRITGFHHAFETVKEEAECLGLRVTGSELVGMTPKQALLDAGKFYLIKQEIQDDPSEEAIIQTAVFCLGLNDKTPFQLDEKIIEYAILKKSR